jgi:hypothetical protein
LQAIAHAPFRQEGLPFVASQAVLHAPQFATSVSRFTSQPFDASPSQLANPGLQTMPHVPEEHVAVPFVASHAVPHAPQWSGSLASVTSHPVDALASQSANPSAQAIAHTPAEQLAVPFVVLQAVPQAPQ